MIRFVKPWADSVTLTGICKVFWNWVQRSIWTISHSLYKNTCGVLINLSVIE